MIEKLELNSHATAQSSDMLINLSNTHGARFILSIVPGKKCLRLFPLVDWEDICTKLDSQSNNPSIRSLKQLITGFAFEITIKPPGKLTLPKPLRVYADISRHIYLYKDEDDRYEIWHPELFTEEYPMLSTTADNL